MGKHFEFVVHSGERITVYRPDDADDLAKYAARNPNTPVLAKSSLLNSLSGGSPTEPVTPAVIDEKVYKAIADTDGGDVLIQASSFVADGTFGIVADTTSGSFNIVVETGAEGELTVSNIASNSLSVFIRPTVIDITNDPAANEIILQNGTAPANGSVTIPGNSRGVVKSYPSGWRLVETINSSGGDVEILPVTTFNNAVQSFTPSKFGAKIRLRHAASYTIYRDDADAGNPPTPTEEGQMTVGTDTLVTFVYPSEPNEVYKHDGIDWSLQTSVTSPGRWDVPVPSLAAREWITYYADVGPNVENATGVSIGVGGANVSDSDKIIRLTLPTGSTLQGSAQSTEYAELEQIGASITIWGLGDDQYAYENHSLPSGQAANTPASELEAKSHDHEVSALNLEANPFTITLPDTAISSSSIKVIVPGFPPQRNGAGFTATLNTVTISDSLRDLLPAGKIIQIDYLKAA